MLRARSSGTKLVLVPTELQLNMDQVYVLVGGILLFSRQRAPVTAEETMPRLVCLVRGIGRTALEKICIVARSEAAKQKDGVRAYGVRVKGRTPKPVRKAIMVSVEILACTTMSTNGTFPAQGSSVRPTCSPRTMQRCTGIV